MSGTGMSIRETIYQEEDDSYFVHDGVWYHLNTVLKLSADLPVVKIAVTDLKWLLDKPTKEDIERADRSDTGCPILVTKWNGKVVTLDGYHRLIKAVRGGEEFLPGKRVSKEILRVAKL